MNNFFIKKILIFKIFIILIIIKFMKLNKVTTQLIDLIQKTKDFSLQNYVKDIDSKKLAKILRDLSLVYYNTGESLVSDEVFDYLKDHLEKIDPINDFLNEVGAPIDSKEKVKLPYPMGSLDKIKPSTQELDKWKIDFKGPYVISDKLDGISAQLYITKDNAQLFTRGDGEYGQDISYLIKYLLDMNKLEKIQKNSKMPISIRGELIISKKNFDKVKDKFKNARNAVAGFVNAKKVDKTLSKLVEFIGYTVINPELKADDQMKYLKALEPLKKVVEHKIYTFDKLTNDILSKYLEDRRNSSEFEVDGIVVYDSSRAYEHSSGNPEYGFAFKTILSDQYAEALVVDVIWEASMDGYLKPKVQINPINLVGVTITYATAFHAKFVEDNKLGPGAVIKLIRSGDVIPHILEILKPSTSGKPKMPNSEYIWDKNHVNILIKNINKSEYTDTIKAKKMDYFFSVLDVKYISLGILTKLVESGYDNIIKILKSDKNELAKIDGLGKKIIDKIFDNIDEVMESVTLEKLMAGSHVFGTGIGERKIKQIIREIPNILDIKTKKELKEAVIDLEGFSDITADKFVDNLDKFKIFYKQLKEIYDLEYIEEELKEKEENNDENKDLFKDQKIVFTGFRDKNLEDIIEIMGGKVSTSVSSKTTLVVYADNEENSSKLEKAKKLEIKVIPKSEFIKKYKLDK
jgi:DNA ligase (NAD+)